MVKRNIDKTMNPPPNIWTFLLYDGRTFVFFELKAEKIKPSKTIPIVVIVFAKLKNKSETSSKKMARVLSCRLREFGQIGNMIGSYS